MHTLQLILELGKLKYQNNKYSLPIFLASKVYAFQTRINLVGSVQINEIIGIAVTMSDYNSYEVSLIAFVNL